MKRGTVVSIAIAVLAVLGMGFAFMANASPYVSVAEAKGRGTEQVHVAGDILKETMRTDLVRREVRFDIRDEKGDVMNVVYAGPPPANLGSATKVVAIGSMKDGAFHSDKMLVKCPSKYEGQPTN